MVKSTPLIYYACLPLVQRLRCGPPLPSSSVPRFGIEWIEEIPRANLKDFSTEFRWTNLKVLLDGLQGDVGRVFISFNLLWWRVDLCHLCWFILIWNNKTLQKSMFALLGSHLFLCWPRKVINLFKAHPSGHIHAEKSELLHLSEGNKPIIQSGEMALIGKKFMGLFSHSFYLWYIYLLLYRKNSTKCACRKVMTSTLACMLTFVWRMHASKAISLFGTADVFWSAPSKRLVYLSRKRGKNPESSAMRYQHHLIINQSFWMILICIWWKWLQQRCDMNVAKSFLRQGMEWTFQYVHMSLEVRARAFLWFRDGFPSKMNHQSGIYCTRFHLGVFLLTVW